MLIILESLNGSWKEGGFVPSSTSSSGYWSWSAPSDQSNPSTPSPPLSADSFRPFRLPSQTDDGIDETETSSLLFDEPIPRKRKVRLIEDNLFEVLIHKQAYFLHVSLYTISENNSEHSIGPTQDTYACPGFCKRAIFGAEKRIVSDFNK